MIHLLPISISKGAFALLCGGIVSAISLVMTSAFVKPRNTNPSTLYGVIIG